MEQIDVIIVRSEGSPDVRFTASCMQRRRGLYLASLIVCRLMRFRGRWGSGWFGARGEIDSVRHFCSDLSSLSTHTHPPKPVPTMAEEHATGIMKLKPSQLSERVLVVGDPARAAYVASLLTVRRQMRLAFSGPTLK